MERAPSSCSTPIRGDRSSTRSCAPTPEPAKIAEAAIDALAGDYETASKLRFTVARQGESLLLTVGSQPPLALVPQSDTSFLLGPLNGKATFEKDDQGRGRRLTLEQGGPPVTAERVGAGKP